MLLFRWHIPHNCHPLVWWRILVEKWASEALSGVPELPGFPELLNLIIATITQFVQIQWYNWCFERCFWKRLQKKATENKECVKEDKWHKETQEAMEWNKWNKTNWTRNKAKVPCLCPLFFVSSFFTFLSFSFILSLALVSCYIWCFLA